LGGVITAHTGLAGSLWSTKYAQLRWPNRVLQVQDSMVHVPYRGGAPAVADLLAGQLQVNFDVLLESIEYIWAGKLRALAVTTATRSEALPDIPTVGEFVPGYETSSWWGVGVPRNAPVEIIDKLNKEINAGIADPELKARLVDRGSTVLPGSAAEFGKFIAAETEK
jgi:tripartite-type tricarboxylate transporter receptor subunit TctC